MGIILTGNDTLLNSYTKGWEQAVRIFEEESSAKKRKRRKAVKENL